MTIRPTLCSHQHATVVRKARHGQSVAPGIARPARESHRLKSPTPHCTLTARSNEAAYTRWRYDDGV